LSFLHPPSLGLSRGHFYFAQRGHYHFAVTPGISNWNTLQEFPGLGGSALIGGSPARNIEYRSGIEGTLPAR
jgi:hypothetical protein